MEKELIDVIVNLKVESKALTLLVDAILDNSRLNYDGSRLTIDDDAPIMAIVKAFRAEEFTNRYKELKADKEA